MSNETLRAMWKEIPRLWVLVTNIGNGTHHFSTMYRGEALGWKVADRDGSEVAVFKSDGDFCKTVQRIQECEGFDQKAWQSFCQRYWDSCVFDCGVTDTNDWLVN